MNIGLIIIIFTVITSYVLSIVCIIILRKHVIQREKEKEHRVVLSFPREQYEDTVHNLANRQIATSFARFNDINGLLLYAKSEPDAKDNPIRNDSFYRSLGIDISNIEIKSKQIMCLLPFHRAYQKQYAVIRNACEENGYAIFRSDSVYDTQNIMQYVIKSILESEYVIAIVDGRNTNVAFEIGIAQSLGKKIWYVADANKMNDVPSNLLSTRIICYKGYEDLHKKVSEVLKSI